MKEKMRIKTLLGSWSVFAACSLVTGCVTTNYMPPPGVPTAHIRFREVNVGGVPPLSTSTVARVLSAE